MSIQEEIIKEMRNLGYTEEQLNNLSMADGCQAAIVSIINEGLKISDSLIDLINSQLDIQESMKIMCDAFDNMKKSREECMKNFKNIGK